MFDIKVEKLSKGLDFLSIDYDHNLINKFILYYEFLNKENKKYNLTSITDFDDFISLHVLDSLSVLLPIQKYNINYQNILDIGSGNGFPGVPFRICIPKTNMILVDSIKKKVNFMQQVIQLLNLSGIEIVNNRIENLGKNKDYRKTQNLILARAVAKLPTLIEIALPLLQIGGYCIFHKSNLSQSEFESMNKTLRYFDAQLIEIYKVPNELVPRNHNLVIIKKNSEIDFEYPRNNNKSFRKPLF
jgi:16S rRNA (guanine527-N7)-methyltransferase